MTDSRRLIRGLYDASWWIDATIAEEHEMPQYLNPDNPVAGVLITDKIDGTTGATVQVSPEREVERVLPPKNDGDEQGQPTKPVKPLTDKDIANAEKQQEKADKAQAETLAAAQTEAQDDEATTKKGQKAQAKSRTAQNLASLGSDTEIVGDIPTATGPEKTAKQVETAQPSTPNPGSGAADRSVRDAAKVGKPANVETVTDTSTQKTNAQRGMLTTKNTGVTQKD